MTYLALLSIYNAQPRHITLSCLVKQIEAHLKIIHLRSQSDEWQTIKMNREREMNGGDAIERITDAVVETHLARARTLLDDAQTEAFMVFGVCGGQMIKSLNRLERRLDKRTAWYAEYNRDSEHGSNGWRQDDEEDKSEDDAVDAIKAALANSTMDRTLHRTPYEDESSKENRHGRRRVSFTNKASKHRKDNGLHEREENK
ncbi:hypothetical protein BD324DRAFT_630882 [Kockovaella imperatae]|uniref:Uncharacterized protein n=1 Tax=Kockovaella imperatae TaxID=4999 RepID=A0A1Y1UDM9_9TREE|nr:hypothetical protein BD324DRAFT_630882 [Kockovaella imperatae]ORX35626.1 hypothetical protein BD324DRAFT_630882 [Kockovaella imperatae]